MLGSDLYAGGNFTIAGGSNANRIAKWDGSAWFALGEGMGGFDPRVNALVFCGSNLYAGGYFTTAGGVAASSIAKWNGTAWSPLGSGVPIGWQVLALAVSGSDVYAGGTWSNGIDRFGWLAKWDGDVWLTLGSGWYGYVVGALAASGSDLYVAGSFRTAGGGPGDYLAKWDGSGWSGLGSGINGPVYALTLSGSDLYAGGYFTIAGGKVSAYVAKAIAIPGDWLQILKDVPGPGSNTLNYVGVPSAPYLVQFATNPNTNDWFTLATNTVGVNGRGMVLDSTATNGQRFYRIIAP